VRLKRNGAVLFEKVVDRSQTQVRFEKVPVGNWVLEAEARGEATNVGVKARGIVKAGNQPVAGAQVTLDVQYPEQVTYTTTTDAEGKFAFNVFPSWFEGYLRVVAEGYPEWEDWVREWAFSQSPDGLVIDLLENRSRGNRGQERNRQYLPVVLASGAISFTLSANEDKQIEVELASKLTDLWVTPPQISVRVNGSVEVAVQGLIEQGADWNPNMLLLYLVPMNPEKVRWQIADSNIASLSADTGLSVTVQGLREGETTLTVTDEESGKSKQVSVFVGQGEGPLQPPPPSQF